MAQFDVYLNPSQITKKHFPYLLDVQHDFLSDLSTRLVIPLGLRASFSNEAMMHLTPEVLYAEQRLLVLTPQMSSVPSNILKNPIGSLSHCRDDIINALDFAISGI